MITINQPTSVPRSRVQAILAELGLNLEHLVSVEITMGEIHAKSYALNEDGYKFIDRGRCEVATHEVTIPIDRDA